jgi:hypothetical protein
MVVEVTAMTSEATLAAVPGFQCATCMQPLTAEDFGDLGLRPPHDGEGRDDYFDAELLDSISHLDCAAAAR